MSDGDYTILGPDGVGSGNIDDHTARALRVAGMVALASHDVDEVDRIMRTEIVLAEDLHPVERMTLAVLVAQELAVTIFGPLFTAFRVDHPDTDLVAQLRVRTGLNARPEADGNGA